MKSTHDGFDKVMFDLEWQIIEEKLSKGVNGVEWLVLHIQLGEERLQSLQDWEGRIKWVNKVPVEKVVFDALTMTSDPFYAKYMLNWWISVDESLTYLSLLKERHYDRYFKFMLELERKGYK